MPTPKFKPKLTRWIRYTGAKNFQTQHLDQFPIPNFETYAEPCCGSAALALYFMFKTSGKNFMLNDRNEELVGLLAKLYQDGPNAVFTDPIWRKYQCIVRCSQADSNIPYRKNRQPDFDNGVGLRELEYCYDLMHKHTITFSSLDAGEFLDTLPPDAFVFFLGSTVYLSSIEIQI
jgi:hypothetical protein